MENKLVGKHSGFGGHSEPLEGAGEWAETWHDSRLDVWLLHAYYNSHIFPRHSHDYYVICLIEYGVQTFTHESQKQFTPPGGLILINPGEVHTGEAAEKSGFEMRSIYATVSQVQAAALKLTGRHQELPLFTHVRVDDKTARKNILGLFAAAEQGASILECESRLTSTLAHLIKYYANRQASEVRLGKELKAVQQARSYIDERFSQGISLTQLAEYVSFSPYYLLRTFRDEIGMPPHAYLESVRIRHAQRLIEAGLPLAEVSAACGYSSQSHMTRRFKRIIGITPGRFFQQAGA